MNVISLLVAMRGSIIILSEAYLVVRAFHSQSCTPRRGWQAQERQNSRSYRRPRTASPSPVSRRGREAATGGPGRSERYRSRGWLEALSIKRNSEVLHALLATFARKAQRIGWSSQKRTQIVLRNYVRFCTWRQFVWACKA
jgi:hypothetical protein